MNVTVIAYSHIVRKDGIYRTMKLMTWNDIYIVTSTESEKVHVYNCITQQWREKDMTGWISDMFITQLKDILANLSIYVNRI